MRTVRWAGRHYNYAWISPLLDDDEQALAGVDMKNGSKKMGDNSSWIGRDEMKHGRRRYSYRRMSDERYLGGRYGIRGGIAKRYHLASGRCAAAMATMDGAASAAAT